MNVYGILEDVPIQPRNALVSLPLPKGVQVFKKKRKKVVQTLRVEEDEAKETNFNEHATPLFERKKWKVTPKFKKTIPTLHLEPEPEPEPFIPYP